MRRARRTADGRRRAGSYSWALAVTAGIAVAGCSPPPAEPELAFFRSSNAMRSYRMLPNVPLRLEARCALGGDDPILRNPHLDLDRLSLLLASGEALPPWLVPRGVKAAAYDYPVWVHGGQVQVDRWTSGGRDLLDELFGRESREEAARRLFVDPRSLERRTLRGAWITAEWSGEWPGEPVPSMASSWVLLPLDSTLGLEMTSMGFDRQAPSSLWIEVPWTDRCLRLRDVS